VRVSGATVVVVVALGTVVLTGSPPSGAVVVAVSSPGPGAGGIGVVFRIAVVGVVAAGGATTDGSHGGGVTVVGVDVVGAGWAGSSTGRAGTVMPGSAVVTRRG
jgi:hypothetical protein